MCVKELLDREIELTTAGFFFLIIRRLAFNRHLRKEDYIIYSIVVGTRTCKNTGH